MKKFNQWLYSLFHPYLVTFFSLVFPNTNTTTVQQVLRNAAIDSVATKAPTRTTDLLSKYRRCKNPQSSYRIFYLRVKYFGWDINHALKTPDRKDEIALVGYRYNLREIYNNAPSRAVPYPLFQRRVVHQGWTPLRALNTPSKKPTH
jgi:hypothetical protein